MSYTHAGSAFILVRVSAMTYYCSPSSPANDANAPLPPWRRGRPGADDRQTPFLFWLTMLALGCVTLMGMAWGGSQVLAQKGSEKLLRVDLLLPKLKSIHWERKAVAFPMSEPVPSAKASPKDRNTTTPPAPPPAIEGVKVHGALPLYAAASDGNHLTPLSERSLPPIVETCDEPVVYLNPCTPQRGDSPMMRNWKTLTMYSLLTAAAATLAPPPVLLAQDDKKLSTIEKLSTDVQTLTRSVQALTTRIGELEKKPIDKAALRGVFSEELKKLEAGKLTELDTAIKSVGTRVDGVKSDISKLQGEQLAHKLQIDNQKTQVDFLLEQVNILNKKLLAVNGAPAGPAAPAVDKAFMEDLRSYMKKLDDTLAKLGATETRTSMSPPIKNGAAPTFGRLVFNNLHGRELLFVVNGRGQSVPPMTKLVLENVPSGTVRCEVFADGLGWLDRRSITLSAGETYALRAIDQP
jgi:hypothetical protein